MDYCSFFYAEYRIGCACDNQDILQVLSYLYDWQIFLWVHVYTSLTNGKNNYFVNICYQQSIVKYYLITQLNIISASAVLVLSTFVLVGLSPHGQKTKIRCHVTHVLLFALNSDLIFNFYNSFHLFPVFKSSMKSRHFPSCICLYRKQVFIFITMSQKLCLIWGLARTSQTSLFYKQVLEHLDGLKSPQHFTTCALSQCFALASSVTAAIILCALCSFLTNEQPLIHLTKEMNCVLLYFISDIWMFHVSLSPWRLWFNIASGNAFWNLIPPFLQHNGLSRILWCFLSTIHLISNPLQQSWCLGKSSLYDKFGLPSYSSQYFHHHLNKQAYSQLWDIPMFSAVVHNFVFT